MRKLTIGFLMLILTSACAPADRDKTAPLLEQEGQSSPSETPPPQVLADCFITFEISAWHDLNSNGDWDSGEPPLEGVSFRINGPFASLLSTNPCISDEAGICQIRTWAPGECMAADYAITAETPDSYTSTTPSEITLSLAPTDFQSSAQFGFAQNDD